MGLGLWALVFELCTWSFVLCSLTPRLRDHKAQSTKYKAEDQRPKSKVQRPVSSHPVDDEAHQSVSQLQAIQLLRSHQQQSGTDADVQVSNRTSGSGFVEVVTEFVSSHELKSLLKFSVPQRTHRENRV
jgi:hypothetical protein